jgi:hypothetical protein
MKPEAQRIAIAEACGWAWHGDPTWARDPESPYWNNGVTNYSRLPDYLNDLNAMHEAEGNFPHPSDWYQHNLALVCGGNNRIYRATASQRAEAFLKTLGLWEGAK